MTVPEWKTAFEKTAGKTFEDYLKRTDIPSSFAKGLDPMILNLDMNTPLGKVYDERVKMVTAVMGLEGAYAHRKALLTILKDNLTVAMFS